jgi:hypothetical protein
VRRARAAYWRLVRRAGKRAAAAGMGYLLMWARDAPPRACL